MHEVRLELTGSKRGFLTNESIFMISLLIGILIIGLILYLVNILPIEPLLKQIAMVVAVVCCIIWLLQSFGNLSTFH